MRLIDADELKKAIMFKEGVAYETWNELYDSVLDEIDNAPTIKTFTLLDIEENFKKGLNIGLSYAPEDRPQGKYEFIEILAQCVPDEICTYPEYRGKPYYSIHFRENGEDYVGFGTYNPEVLSRYLRDYFFEQKGGADMRDEESE